MIVVKGLTKRFGDVLAVDGLDMEVKPGEIFGFLGPNGAGKTTTIRMLSALISPTSGEAKVAGYEVGREDNEIRRNVGILTESPGLYARLSAERNLSFFAELYDVEDVAGQVERYLRLLGLWDRRGDVAATFSKGMRQKLAIARAMLHEPKVLFLDEPTAGLDPEMARLVREFINELKDRGRTIFLCTHNLDEADRLCDRIAVVNTRLLALDTPEALRAKLYDRVVVIHLSAASPAYEKVVSEQSFVRSVEIKDNKLVVGLDDPERNNPELIRALVDAGADIQFVGELRRSLEEIYLRLVK
ncbi:MAG: ABC transporter ATP-binding protein [Anaerolineales bacterium]|jgi:ABC-2 type transport system ATP-binding protein|nr:MAG: ABC transporter ATP-binding protein [Anaerolineales bacterium]